MASPRKIDLDLDYGSSEAEDATDFDIESLLQDVTLDLPTQMIVDSVDHTNTSLWENFFTEARKLLPDKHYTHCESESHLNVITAKPELSPEMQALVDNVILDPPTAAVVEAVGARSHKKPETPSIATELKPSTNLTRFSKFTKIRPDKNEYAELNSNHSPK